MDRGIADIDNPNRKSKNKSLLRKERLLHTHILGMLLSDRSNR